MFGLISAGVGLLGGLSSSKSAKKSAQAAEKLQREQLEFEQKRYNDALTQYKPVEDKLIAKAMETINPDYAGVTDRAISTVNSQFAGGEEARLRAMQRTGVNPNSGRADALSRQLSIGRSLSLAGNINSATLQEKQRADNVGYERLYNVNSLGANKLNGASNGLASAQTAMIQTQQNNATNSANAASGLFSGAGQLAGNWYAQPGNAQKVAGWGSQAANTLSGLFKG